MNMLIFTISVSFLGVLFLSQFVAFSFMKSIIDFIVMCAATRREAMDEFSDMIPDDVFSLRNVGDWTEARRPARKHLTPWTTIINPKVVR